MGGHGEGGRGPVMSRSVPPRAVPLRVSQRLDFHRDRPPYTGGNYFGTVAIQCPLQSSGAPALFTSITGQFSGLLLSVVYRWGREWTRIKTEGTGVV